MTTPPIVSITDELIAELDLAANACGPMLLDSAETLTPADAGAIECPVCYGEGYASLENDYCNFDNHAIGVQFYGIGGEFGAGERYFRAASPAFILALLAERAELVKDRGRLNSLDQLGYAYGFQDMHEGNRWEIDGPFSDVRKALDAMQAAQ
jgi:hypothetical protein